MHIDVITTLSLKDDDGKEITRSTGKARTISFTLEDEVQPIARKINSALNRATRLGQEAVTGILAALRS